MLDFPIRLARFTLVYTVGNVFSRFIHQRQKSNLENQSSAGVGQCTPAYDTGYDTSMSQTCVLGVFYVTWKRKSLPKRCVYKVVKKYFPIITDASEKIQQVYKCTFLMLFTSSDISNDKI